MGSVAGGQQFKVDSVCIIGAGPSGVAAAKYLSAEKSFSRIAIFEQRATVGGIWNYESGVDRASRDLPIPQTSPHAGANKPSWDRESATTNSDEGYNDEVSFISPLYDRLETNIPRGLMGFSDLEWDPQLQLFPKRTEVLNYIDQYAADVRHLIEFQTQVVDVSRTETHQWLVKTQAINRTADPTTAEHIFDAVIVASGHFDVPHVPSVPGIEAWNRAYPGRITHSKFYRVPEQYVDQKVVVVGNSASGSDIGAQIMHVCRPPLIQSQRSESLFLSDTSVAKVEKPPIAEYIVRDRSLKFEDGSVESHVDVILYCTGYYYSFPFLRRLSPTVVTTGERTENLYQHIFYRPQPTLAFLVLNQKVIPFPVAEAQSAVIARVWSGRLTLPGDDDMAKWEQGTVEHYGSGKRFHVLKFPEDAEYLNMLHDWAMSAGGGKDRDRSDFTPGDTRLLLVGKTPPYWGEEECWMRQRFPTIKKAFQDLGEERHSIRTLEEVGYDYKRWKRESAS